MNRSYGYNSSPYIGEVPHSGGGVLHCRRPLRHLHRHLEEPMGGIRRAFPIRPIRQVRLAPDRVAALDPVRVQVRRPCDLRNAAHKLNPRREHRCRVRRVCSRHVVLPNLQRLAIAAPLAGHVLRRRLEVGIKTQAIARQPSVRHRLWRRQRMAAAMGENQSISYNTSCASRLPFFTAFLSHRLASYLFLAVPMP